MFKKVLISLLVLAIFIPSLSFADIPNLSPQNTTITLPKSPGTELIEEVLDPNAYIDTAPDEFTVNSHTLLNNKRRIALRPAYEVRSSVYHWETSGRGPLELSANYTNQAVWDATVEVDASIVSASVGFSLSESWSFSSSTTYTPPNGKFGWIRAYKKYREYDFDIYEGNKKVGTGYVLKPIGVIFTKGY